ncbi:hypothetical protein QAD02_004621 [Eretmocerus hayati]|uniref:Uncharacterized protein n=1 Tax=Eretmocerus hayati TaxID=131215 RepID=A0ACC2NQ28_9HYME|nr:hypothetical protein QAD02_004621 [Eretmocerus hayati]
MLLQLCTLCKQAVERPMINIRRHLVKYSKASADYFSDDEYEDYLKEDVSKETEGFIPKPKRPCIIKCRRSKFDFYQGDTFPKFEAIPLVSRGWQHRLSKGDYFTIYPTESSPQEELVSSLTFEDIKLNPKILESLEDMGIKHPTPIQKLGIPSIMDRKNVILTAETGCGKTLAFLLPVLQQILQWKSLKHRGVNKPVALILTPSTELTTQISNVAKKLTKGLDINIVTHTGGKTRKIIYNPPITEVDLVISTVGVMNTLVGNCIYNLDEVRHVVLDEADTLFDITFKKALCNLLRKIKIGNSMDVEVYPSAAQLTLNSATIPEKVEETLQEIVDTSSLLRISTGYEHSIRVPQRFMRVIGPDKPAELLKFVKPKVKSKIPIIIFSNTAATCDYTNIFLKKFNINSVNLHGKMSLDYRRKKYFDFKNGICNVLTTTDAGARGLDTIYAKDVINYDFPLVSAEYIHRCGRIGRIGSPKDCRVINFIQRPLEVVMTCKIEFAIRKGKPIPMIDLIHSNEDVEGEFIRPDLTEQMSDPTEKDDDSFAKSGDED